MAPNRKNVSDLVESLSSNDLQSLQNAIQPKYLPLTHPKEEQQHLEKQQQSQQVESVSYWDWPAAVEEEKVVLSLSNVVVSSNLIQSPAAVSSTKESHLVAAHDDYWADYQQSEEAAPVAVNKPQHIESPYWDWPAEQDSNKATINRILVEEKAYRLVSAATTEDTEMTAESPSEPRQVHTNKASNDQYWRWNSAEVAGHTLDESHPNNSYWDWDANQEEKQEHPFQALLEYEAVRQMLTAESIVSQMQSREAVSSACTQERSDDYWGWSEHYGDQYWDFQQPAVVATGSYWDW
jgi:hypothetical protein